MLFCFKWGKAGWVLSSTLFGVYVDGMLEKRKESGYKINNTPPFT